MPTLSRPEPEGSSLPQIANWRRMREERARAEGQRYLWVQDPDTGDWQLVTGSGSTYEVARHGRHCNCPDYEDRCQELDIPCKHLCAFRAVIGVFMTLETFNSPAGAAIWHALHPGERSK